MDGNDKLGEFLPQSELSSESCDSQGSLSGRYNINISIKLSSSSSSSNSPPTSQTTQLRQRLEKDNKFLPQSPTDAAMKSPCPKKMLKARYANLKLKEVQEES
jgi:hypothetical protein